MPHLVTDGPKNVGPWEAPLNSWKLTETPPPEGVKCGGVKVGDRVCDVRLPDQYGDEVSLWQFWGDVILFDISTLWCAPCRNLAESTNETVEHFAADGFTYVTVIAQDSEGGAPEQEHAEQWAEAFGIEAPVLYDNSMSLEAADTTVFPVLILIDRDMRVYEKIGTAEATVVDQEIEDLIRRGG